jgi:hypothetical protein
MTSAVLILSMLPVAFGLGDGAEARAPLGAVLVGGMVTSTFLSLLYVPVAYTYFDSLGSLIQRLPRSGWHQPGWRRAIATRVDRVQPADGYTEPSVVEREPVSPERDRSELPV